MKTYGILSKKYIEGGYNPFYATLTEAKEAAYKASQAYSTSVVVFEVVGEYKIESSWAETAK